jgi:hypothetical protein
VICIDQKAELWVDVVLIEFESKPFLNLLNIYWSGQVFIAVVEFYGLHQNEVIPIDHRHLP